MMDRILAALILMLFFGCKQSPQNEFKPLTARQIIDSAIAKSGGARYLDHDVSYTFRDKRYKSTYRKGKKILIREMLADSATITDVKTNSDFKRFINGEAITLPDTVSNAYANSVNSVHYFSRLPFGLNDPAVQKSLLGESRINGVDHYKIQVTFSEENGGKDFEDIYLYWFDKQTYKPTYLAYKFYTDGGGMRFREAYNERFVGGIRFVDYNNFKPKKGDSVAIEAIDGLFTAKKLELLSKIELTEISVDPIVEN